MKTKLFAVLAAIAVGSVAAPASAHERDRSFESYRHSPIWRQADITVRANGRVFDFGYGDRMFTRLIDRPYSFVPGLNYVYTDRCNRYGCVVFVYDDYRRRPIDRIFAPHLPMPRYAWRQARGFDPRYRGYGQYNRDDRAFDDSWRYEQRDDRWNDRDRTWDDRPDDWDDNRRRDSRLEGAPHQR